MKHDVRAVKTPDVVVTNRSIRCSIEYSPVIDASRGGAKDRTSWQAIREVAMKKGVPVQRSPVARGSAAAAKIGQLIPRTSPCRSQGLTLVYARGDKQNVRAKRAGGGARR